MVPLPPLCRHSTYRHAHVGDRLCLGADSQIASLPDVMGLPPPEKGGAIFFPWVLLCRAVYQVRRPHSLGEPPLSHRLCEVLGIQ